MQLHLVFPGLLWPAKALHDTAHDLHLPALSRLLGRAHRDWQPPLAWEHWLCAHFGLAAFDPPIAALRLLGEDIDPGAHFWLCADPAHLAFEQGRLILAPEAPEIDGAAMEALLERLRPQLEASVPGYAELRPGRPGSGHAYLRLTRLPELQAPPPSAAASRSLHFVLPGAGQADAWTRLTNEVQMQLHALPENRVREASGLRAINTLWFWGAGALPAAARCPAAAPATAIHARGALARGIARWAGVEAAALPEHADQLPAGGDRLVCVDELALPAQALDANRWRATLTRLECNWLAPAAAAYFSGKLTALRITALGPEATVDLHLRRGDRLKFWRKPQPLTALIAPSAGLPA